MGHLTISEVARQVGLQPSAIRYYERIGLLPTAERTSGQRRYDRTAIYRLAIIYRGRQLGFTLDEIRQLFFGFQNGTRASMRWDELSRQKLAELDLLMDGITHVRRLLKALARNCDCATLEQCGKRIFQTGFKNGENPSAATKSMVYQNRKSPIKKRKDRSVLV